MTGSNRLHFVVAIAAFCTFVESPQCDGQVRIRARDKPQTVLHSLKDEPQTFEPVRWDLQNRFPNGCVVEWEADVFRHGKKASSKADCHLSIQVTRSSPRSADWRVTAEHDATSLKGGKETARVSVASSSEGNGRVEMIVRFVQDDVFQLAAGDYRTTIVGTISGL